MLVKVSLSTVLIRSNSLNGMYENSSLVERYIEYFNRKNKARSRTNNQR